MQRSHFVNSLVVLASFSQFICGVHADQVAPATIQLSINPNRQHALSQDLYGANNECIFRPVWFDHPAYVARYNEAGKPFFRFPGGTGSNFYNPSTGYFDDDSPSTRDYSGHNARIHKFTDGAGRVPDQYLKWVKQNDVAYSLVLNVCTQTFEQNRAWIERLGREGHQVARIEIGNEVFYDNYKWAFSFATEYVQRAERITAVIRKELPDTEIGVLVPTHVYQDLDFLTDKRSARADHPYGWIKELKGKEFFDAIVMHMYSLTEMSSQTEPEEFIPYLEGYHQCDDYLSLRFDKTLADVNRLFPDKNIWMTEYGVGGFGGTLKQYKLRDAHLGALHADVMLMRFINHPSVTVAHWHSFQHFFDFTGGVQGIGEHPHLPYLHFSLFKDAIRQSDSVHAVIVDGAEDDVDATVMMKDSAGYLIIANRLGNVYKIKQPVVMANNNVVRLKDVLQLSHLDGQPLAVSAQNLERCESTTWIAKPNQSIVLPPYSITRIKFSSRQ
ncbi:hypothetical protein [Crateriforma conspicua]|uniref:hypothetical protein n=1 Tax=Crateriforma conspicua TaxID=2527996 RepID=UPI00118ADC5F|nr:hypothetical protein [Crateriforma conspicua]QDV63984.1 hypothetical protein Mal65_31320 [Crateriforma conspicua]